MDIYNVRKEMKENNKTVFDMPLRVAYYARVSTGADEQIHSLAVQKKHVDCQKQIISKPYKSRLQRSGENRELFIECIC